MGFTCGGSVSGNTIAELVAGIQKHVVQHHGYTEAEAQSPQKIAEWRGAVASSSRDPQIRTPRQSG